jgi:hypothetical protein
MSWNIKLFGSKGAVKSKIENDEHLSSNIKLFLLSCLSDDNYNEFLNGVRIETFGHAGNVGKLEVEQIHIELSDSVQNLLLTEERPPHPPANG